MLMEKHHYLGNSFDAVDPLSAYMITKKENEFIFGELKRTDSIQDKLILMSTFDDIKRRSSSSISYN